MERNTLLALGAGLLVASGSALAGDFPRPSFDDAADLNPQVVTGHRVFAHQFPKSGATLGGPTGPATVLLQSEAPYSVRQAAVEPSFKG